MRILLHLALLSTLAIAQTTIQGTGTWQGSITLQNSPAVPNFTVSLSTSSVSFAQGASTPITVTITSTNGFTGPVTLSTGSLTTGTTAAFVPPVVTPPSNGTITSTLTLTASATATTGTTSTTVNGASGSLNNSANLTYTITASGVTHLLTVTLNGLGTVSSSPAGIACTPTCTANFANGTVVVLTEVPAAGQIWTGWSGDCAGTATTCSVTMSADHAVTATFTPSTGFLAYSGLAIVPWGDPTLHTIPDLGGTLRNNATVFDTSFTSYGEPVGNLAPVTRCTDRAIVPGRANISLSAGTGGSGAGIDSSLDSKLQHLNTNGSDVITIFNTTTGACGDPTTGKVVTTDKNTAGGGSSGTWFQAGSGNFTLNPSNPNPYTWFSFGLPGQNDTSVFTIPFCFTGAGSCPTGPTNIQYTVPASPTADFFEGIPVNDNLLTYAAARQPSHSYNKGDYMSVDISSILWSWLGTTAVQAGDVAVFNGCLYKVSKVGTTGVTPPSRSATCTLGTFIDGTVTWKGVGGPPKFIYQNIGATGATSASATLASNFTNPVLTSVPVTLSESGTTVTISGSTANLGQAVTISGAAPSGYNGTFPVTSVASNGDITVTNSTTGLTAGTATLSTCPSCLSRHPDLLSVFFDGGSVVWQNIGPAINASAITWISWAGTDTTDTRFAEATSTTTYGNWSDMSVAGSGPNYASSRYNGGQGSGIWVVMYDTALNKFHTYNSLTQIFTDVTCSGGTGWNCSGGAFVPVPLGLGTAYGPGYTGGSTIGTCSYLIHNAKMLNDGNHMVITEQGSEMVPGCPVTSSMFGSWAITQAFSAPTQIQQWGHGLNHWATGKRYVVSLNNSGYGSTSGVYMTLNDSQNPTWTGANWTTGNCATCPPIIWQAGDGTAPGSGPNSCSATSAGPPYNPPACDLSKTTDNHLSMAYNPGGTDSSPVCGSTYNYANLSPVATEAWQSMETCTSSVPSWTDPTAPSTSAHVWQFTHTFATGTNDQFNGQFQISQYSQDGQWLFWTSDWNSTLGTTDGSDPTCAGVYPCTNGFLIAPFDQFSSATNCIGGWPWQANHAYRLGEIIHPIKGTAGGGTIYEPVQATAIAGGGLSGATAPLWSTSAARGTTYTDNQVTWTVLATTGNCATDVFAVKLK